MKSSFFARVIANYCLCTRELDSMGRGHHRGGVTVADDVGSDTTRLTRCDKVSQDDLVDYRMAYLWRRDGSWNEFAVVKRQSTRKTSDLGADSGKSGDLAGGMAGTVRC